MFTKHAWTPPWLKVMAVGVTVPPGLALTRKSPAALTTAPATATLAGVKNGTAAKGLVELSEYPSAMILKLAPSARQCGRKRPHDRCWANALGMYEVAT